MESKKTRNYKRGPEDEVQDAIVSFLELRGWFCKKTHGNLYSWGFPDLYATHYRYGYRWVEVKLPGMKGSRFTAAQKEDFPKFMANGTGIWVMTEATEEEYRKLFDAPNITEYMDI